MNRKRYKFATIQSFIQFSQHIDKFWPTMISTALLFGLLAVTLGDNAEQATNAAGSRNKLLERAQMKLSAQNLVDTVNRKQSLWKAEFNARFAYMDIEDKRLMMGTRLDDNDHFKGEAIIVPDQQRVSKIDSDLPESFNTRESVCADVIGEIQDQSKCGSCWAVSSASAMSDRICLKSGGKVKVDISAADVMSCSIGFGCMGGWPLSAWMHFKVHGFVSGGKSYRLGLFYHEEDIRREILENGPVVSGFLVHEDFLHYKEGVYQYTTGKLLGGHAVRIIGWGEEKGTKYWLVANSWNTDWGDQGLFKIIRGTNECNFESSITFGEPDLDN